MLIIAAGLCVWFLATHREDLAAVWQRAEPVLLVAATAVFVVFVVIQVRLSVWVLQILGGRVPTMAAGRIVLLSLLGKYVPGKIWVAAMRTGFLSRHGVPTTIALASVVVEHVFLFATGAACFGAALFVGSSQVGVWALAAALLLLMFLIIAPGAPLRAASAILSRLGLITPAPDLDPRRAFVITIAYLANWLVLGFGIRLLASGLGLELPLSALVQLAGTYGIAVIGGLLAFFAPAGVGVREGLFTAAMSGHLPTADAMFLALAARLCITVAELLATGLAVAWRGRPTP